MEDLTLRRIAFWTTLASGAIAAFLLYRRGVPPAKIASKVFTHPVGTFINELHIPAPQPREA